MSDLLPPPADPVPPGLLQHPDLPLGILAGLAEWVLLTDATGRIVYSSAPSRLYQGGQLQGLTTEEWRAHFLFHDADTHEPLPEQALPLPRALRGEEVPSMDLFYSLPSRQGGRYLRASARPVRDREGRQIGALVLMRDVAEERRVQAERRRAELRFRLIVEAAQEGIWMLDRAGLTTYVNHFMAHMLGYAPEEMLERPVLDFVAPDNHDQVTRNLQERARGRSSVHDLPLRHKDGHHVWALVSSNPMRDETGQYVGALATVTDITQRREAEQQVRRLNEELERRIAERTAQLELTNRELEAFAYSVAHDLRAPLRAISAFGSALSEDCAAQLDATGQDYLTRIQAAAQRMSELIDGLLTLSRVTRTGLQLTDVPLSTLARAVTEQLRAAQPGRAVRVRIEEGLVERGDARMLRSVLENLLGNAWKFTRERAEASLEFGVVRGGPAGPGRVYFVRDNGAGFDMAYQARLFGVFQRLHTQQEFEGHGVGLATVQRIIQRHGGRVWAEAVVDEGATFFFTLNEAPAGGPPTSREEPQST